MRLSDRSALRPTAPKALTLATSVLLALTGCSPAAYVSVEVVDDQGQPVKGTALSIADNLGFKLHAQEDADGCISARGVPTRGGGRNWRMTVDAPGYKPARIHMQASGRHAYVVSLQADASRAESAWNPVDALPSCTRQ